MSIVIDNLTLIKECKPPKVLLNANGKPFEYKDIIFYPHYQKGELRRYDGQLKNLRLYWYPEKVIACNSIHKYWHGNNYSDFYLEEMKAAIESLCDSTSINWKNAIFKSMEYGCNVEAKATTAYRSLTSYKGKDYLPMQFKGKIYGAYCEFTDYKIKGYNKSFQVQKVDKITLGTPLFRWEVVSNRQRNIETTLELQAPTLKDLLLPATWKILANDAVMKYQRTLKVQQFHLARLSLHEKRILAMMLLPEFKEDLKLHHNETFRRDRRIFNRILASKNLCQAEDIAGQLKQKFEQLIEFRDMQARA
jgi:hypothetical protein